MRLYLVRHGIAVDRETPGLVSDAARELTPEGIEKMRQNVRALRRLGAAIDKVFSSPLIRARQTAEILADSFSSKPTVEVIRALQPGGHFEDLLLCLEKNSQLEAVAMVGHEPSLGEFTGFVIGGPRNLAIPLKKGGVACIEINEFHPPLHGELLWLLTPKIMGSVT